MPAQPKSTVNPYDGTGPKADSNIKSDSGSDLPTIPTLSSGSGDKTLGEVVVVDSLTMTSESEEDEDSAVDAYMLTAKFEPRMVRVQPVQPVQRTLCTAEAEGYRTERALMDCVAPPSKGGDAIHQCPRADSWLLRGVFALAASFVMT